MTALVQLTAVHFRDAEGVLFETGPSFKPEDLTDKPKTIVVLLTSQKDLITWVPDLDENGVQRKGEEGELLYKSVPYEKKVRGCYSLVGRTCRRNGHGTVSLANGPTYPELVGFNLDSSKTNMA